MQNNSSSSQYNAFDFYKEKQNVDNWYCFKLKPEPLILHMDTNNEPCYNGNVDLDMDVEKEDVMGYNI